MGSEGGFPKPSGFGKPPPLPMVPSTLGGYGPDPSQTGGPRATCGYLEGMLLHSAHDVPEEDLGGEGVTVVHDGLRVGTVPAVDLQTATALP